MIEPFKAKHSGLVFGLSLNTLYVRRGGQGGVGALLCFLARLLLRVLCFGPTVHALKCANGLAQTRCLQVSHVLWKTNSIKYGGNLMIIRFSFFSFLGGILDQFLIFLFVK